MSKKAFTLIELLVVIAIIALLVSILLPSLRTAKELAYKAACASNLHHIGLAQALYANDHGGYYADNNPPLYSWARELADNNVYLDGDTNLTPRVVELAEDSLWYCEAAKEKNPGTLAYGSWERFHGSVARWGNSSYKINGVNNIDPKQTYSYGSKYGSPIPLSQIYKPSDRFMLGEGMKFNGGAISPNNWLATNYHADACNLLFGDFHVESLTDDEILPPLWSMDVYPYAAR